jgi:PAS domain S-box-containing protein
MFIIKLFDTLPGKLVFRLAQHEECQSGTHYLKREVLKKTRKLRNQIKVSQVAREALKESRTHLRTLLDTLPDLVWLKDPQGIYLSCNIRVEDFFGAKEKDIIGKTDYDFVSRELADFFRKHDQLAMAKGMATKNEEEVTFAADGQPRILETIKTPMHRSDGHLVGVLGIGRDITDRKRAEDSLRKSEEKYRRIFENSVVGIYRSTPDGRFTRVNPTFAGMLGYPSPEELVAGITDIEKQFYVHPEDRKRFRKLVDQHGRVEDFEFEVRRKDGSTIWLSVSTRAFFDENGQAEAYEGFVSDITARKRAEKDHQQSEERYRSLVENTLDGYFICEIPSGKFIFLNQRICDLFRYPMPDALALTVWDVIDPGEHQLIKKRIRARMEGTASGHADHTHSAVRQDGSTFRVEVSNSVVTYKGEPAVQGVLRDITEKERLQLQLQQAQKMESVGRLAGGVAHDYNNMLSVIIGYTELALDKVPPDDPLHDDLEEILTAGMRSTDITRQLLAFARQQTIAPKVLDLNGTVESMLKMLRRLIGEDIDLAWYPGAGLWPVKMDPTQIDQILAKENADRSGLQCSGG